MAQDPNNNSAHGFDKELNQGVTDYHADKSSWIFARNAIPNSKSGDVGDIGNEPANILSIQAPYDIIGTIYLYDDNFAIFSTDDVDSEVGFYTESTSVYVKIVNDKCLNFNRKNLITGVAKKAFNCDWYVYFADEYRNPDRVLNITNVPYIQNCAPDPITPTCIICTNILPLQLNCNAIRLAKLTATPCVKVEKSKSGGSLLNGSYFATIAYTINGQKVTDYFGLSNSQAIFSHSNESGSINIILSDLDTGYDEYELVVVSVINAQTSAKRIGLYSTRQTVVSLDVIASTLISIPLEFIPIHNPIIDSSDSISEVGNYMLRIKPREKFDFNYQPLANQIRVNWVSVEYPADYYRNGGNNPSFLRDENYALFIQWLYNDGDVSSSYHIPNNSIFNANFLTINTAAVTSITTTVLPDGGIQIAEGTMGYYQTTEIYPNDKPAVWGTLCGKNIRHHKMPEPATNTRVLHYVDTGIGITGPAIRVLGIKAYNIQPPVDNQGNPITNIVGYRILRGSREGNKTIVAKGMINNLLAYGLKDGSGKIGLFPNYPYNSGVQDPYLSAAQTSTGPVSGTLNDPIPNVQFPFGPQHNVQTFHSPDTQFKHPFLVPTNLKVYCLMQGNSTGKFVYPEKHPKYKFITNALFVMGLVGGIGLAIIKLNGSRRTKYSSPSLQFIDSGTEIPGVWAIAPIPPTGPASAGGGASGSSGLFGMDNPTSIALAGTAATGLATATTGFTTASNLPSGQNNIASLATILTGGATPNPYWVALSAATVAGVLPGLDAKTEIEEIPGLFGNMPSIVAATQGLPLFSGYTNEGYDAIIRFIKDANVFRHAALQYESHCFYDDYSQTYNPLTLVGLPVNVNNPVLDSNYLGSGFQEFSNTYKINNLFRSPSVVLKTNSFIAPHPNDNSKFTLATCPVPIDYKNPTDTSVNATAASYYGALKIDLRNQYGQIGAIRQIPFGCKQNVIVTGLPQAPFTSAVLFGGDTYITRYAERNTMFFFYEWLYGQSDDFEFDYLAHKMLPYPKYWVNSDTFELASFFSGLLPSLASFSLPPLPSGNRALDNTGYGNITNHGVFLLKNAYFYLFNSGVRDFYVESEINTFYRDWESGDKNRFYDNYTYSDLPTLFKTPNIKNLDFYKYDYSLSVGKTFVDFISWANVQPVYYDPIKAETCFVNHDRRLSYSLPQQFELIRDNWRIFPANNYKDFRAVVTGVKSLNQNGAIIFFETDGPIQIQSVETLNTVLGTKITIGDGALFSLPQQSLTNTDRSYEYGSCQNMRSVVNTPLGIFFISQNQGKIFAVSGPTLFDIAGIDEKWWLLEYLPYKLLEKFPTFELTDNPVVGIGCQSAYDNDNYLIFFMKKDYRVRLDITNVVTYISGDDFLVDNMLQVKLGDPNYFEDCSWTLSYDLKNKQWVSYHDWHPGLVMATKQTFSTILKNGIWKHNLICNGYCNYYGVDYPFEIQYLVNTALQVNVLKSIEYQLEIYKYAPNCTDRYLLLEENFDEAIVSNTEQVSGLLRLNQSPVNDPQLLVSYPIINPNSIDILYSKVENKYRFNQFFDITDDRGEFSNAQRQIWTTAGNGYSKTLNPFNLNYTKDPLQHKRFRNYTNSVFLRKLVSGYKKFLFIISVNKNVESKR